MHERRQEPRAKSMYKSAYIKTESGLKFVTLRNISQSGVCFDAWQGVAEGDNIEFYIDASGLVKGTVCWVKNGLCGISADESDTFLLELQRFPPRSVRLPLSGAAELYVDGCRENVTLGNISIRGACVGSCIALDPGQLVTLRISGVCFELATVRWVKKGLFGLRFAEPLHPATFKDLIARIQKPRDWGHEKEQVLIQVPNGA